MFSNPEKKNANAQQPDQTNPFKWLQPTETELDDDSLNEVSGGINPQPLPPRGEDFRKGNLAKGYIRKTEKN